MTLLIIIVVGIVVGQTWLDWRDADRRRPFPAWASGLALACVLAAMLTTVTSLASIFYRDTAGEFPSGFGSALLWPQLGFLLCALGVVVVAVRQKRGRTLLLLAGLLTAAFWFGLALSS